MFSTESHVHSWRASGNDLSACTCGGPLERTSPERVTREAARQARELRNAWDRTNIGGRTAVITVGAVLAGASVAAVIGNQETRQFAFDAIKGRTIPIPTPAPLGVKGLQLSASVRIAMTSFSLDAYSLSLSLDVLKLLAR